MSLAVYITLFSTWQAIPLFKVLCLRRHTIHNVSNVNAIIIVTVVVSMWGSFLLPTHFQLFHCNFHSGPSHSIDYIHTHTHTHKFMCVSPYLRRSQWPHGLRRGSEAARLLVLWVRIPLRHRCLLWVLYVRSLRRADHSPREVLQTVVRRRVWSRNLKNEEAMARVGP